MSERWCEQEIGWHGLFCRVPADWEVLRYTNCPIRGELEFHTRDGLQAVFRWRRLDRQPDVLRMLTTFHRQRLAEIRHPEAEEFAQLTHRREGEWILAWDQPGIPCHAARYLPAQRVFQQWVFTDYQPDHCDTVINELLQSAETNAEAQRHWRLIGIRADLSQDWRPVEVQAIPANVEMVFEGPSHAHIHLRRWGLADILLQGHDLFSFYGSLQKQLFRRVFAERRLDVFGWPAVELEIEQRGWFGFEKMVGSWWPGRAVIWHDRKAKRLYAYETIGRKGVSFPELRDVWA